VLEIDPVKLIPDPEPSADELPFMGDADKAGSAYLRSALLAVIAHLKANPKAPFKDLPAEVRPAFFNGLAGQLKFKQGPYSYKSVWRGALPWLRDRLEEAPSEKVRVAIEEMVSPSVCVVCGGRRLRTDSLAVRVGGRGIADYTAMTIGEAIKAVEHIKLDKREEQIAGLILREIKSRLGFLEAVGLGYLTLDRPSATLPG